MFLAKEQRHCWLVDSSALHLIAKQGSTPPGQPYAHEKYSGSVSHKQFDASRRTNAYINLQDADFLKIN